MAKFDFDSSSSRKSPAFKRLASKKAGASGADPPGNMAFSGSCGVSIFNQVQVSKCSDQRCACESSSLAGLREAVDDLHASASTLYSLSEASREVRDANWGASAASVKEVEAAARLAEELGRRIVKDNQTATQAQAGKLNVATVHRLLRS